MKRLDLVVGPNGAGKSTFIATFLQPRLPLSVFVNADVIAAERWPESAESHSYEAARIASRMRSALIEHGESFIAETVFSHRSKLELIDEAQRAGYHVELHVIVVPVELSVARVGQRVIEGGHSVPEDKIRERYQRLWALVAVAIGRSDSATVYDTSRGRVAIAARYLLGQEIGEPAWPTWAPKELTG